MNSFVPLDFRLLLVFEAILQEGSVSRAGVRLGISQAATSNALNRLRIAIGDQLFTRGPSGMIPTMRAIEMSGPVLSALTNLRGAIARRQFVADTTDRTFRLSLSDQAVMVVLPRLLNLMRLRAPNARLEVESKWNAKVEEQLDRGSIDVAIGIIPTLATRFERKRLFSDHYVCMMREGHPIQQSRMTRKLFSEADHLAVRPSLDRAQMVDEALGRLGCPRRVVLNVNQFLAVPAILKETDLIAYMLDSVAAMLTAPGLVAVTVPFASRKTDIVMAWSSLKERDHDILWLRALILEACSSL